MKSIKNNSEKLQFIEQNFGKQALHAAKMLESRVPQSVKG